MTLEIKELEAEIEKIKKEWRLNQVMKNRRIPKNCKVKEFL